MFNQSGRVQDDRTISVEIIELACSGHHGHPSPPLRDKLKDELGSREHQEIFGVEVLVEKPSLAWFGG
ncbi:MAG: hypothetical protein CMJ20_10685 [Phycisphaeraceae bacterium]|nr:hypothetical protein [Phycisphaeraceae bacterium]